MTDPQSPPADGQGATFASMFGPFTFPGAVFLGMDGQPYALLQKTNFRTQWVFRWADGIKEWVSLREWHGEYLGKRMSAAHASLYGVIDSGQEIKP